jgi:hypothetical protein
MGVALAELDAAVDAYFAGDGLDSDGQMAAWIRSERMAGTMVFDVEDGPTAGSKCYLCGLKGGATPAHYCPAKGVLRKGRCEEYAVCLACGMGEMCGQALAVMRCCNGVGEFGEMEADAHNIDPGHSVPLEAIAEDVLPVAAHPWAAVKASLSVDNLRTARAVRVKQAVIKQVSKLKESKGEQMGKIVQISDEIKAAIRAEPASASTSDLVKKYGLSDGTTRYIRWRGAKMPGGVARQKTAVKLPAGAKTNTEILSVAQNDGRMGLATVSLSIPLAALEAYLMRLPVEDKIRIVSREIAESGL